MLAVFTNNALDRLSFGTVNIVILDDLLDLFKSVVNHFFVIAGTILSQQILQYVCRHWKTSLHEESQILSYNLADKGVHYFLL